MPRTVVLALLFLPACALPQEDPLETRLYDVGFLTRPVPDLPGDPVGITAESLGTTISGTAEDDGILSGAELIDLIRANIDAASWKDPGHPLAFSRDVLTVTQRRSVHERIVRCLDCWRA